MNTKDYLNKIRSRYRISSAYAVAKLLKVSQPTVGRYDKGISTFDDDIASRVADLLGLHPEIVMLDMHMERAQSDEVRKRWENIQEGFHAPSQHADSGLRTSLTW